jgi:serine protease Do
VGIQNLDSDLAEQFDAQTTQGVLVTEVSEEGAAAEAGLRRGDIITEFAGRKVEDGRSLRLAVASKAPGSKVDLKVLRDGKERTFNVTLKSLPAEEEVAGVPGGERESRDVGALRGVGIGDLDAAVRQQFQIPRNVEGVVVTSVEPESAAYKEGLRPGDVIQEINRKPVTSAEEAIEICEKAKAPVTLVHIWRQGTHAYIAVNEGSREG